MENLYNLPNLYDVFYNEKNEAPLREHYNTFDCVMSTGNSLPHVNNDGLLLR